MAPAVERCKIPEPGGAETAPDLVDGIELDGVAEGVAQGAAQQAAMDAGLGDGAAAVPGTLLMQANLPARRQRPDSVIPDAAALTLDPGPCCDVALAMPGGPGAGR